MSDEKTRIIQSSGALDRGVRLNDTYEIDERIASGGMGEVYRGHNIQTGEPVAIKTVLPELARDEAILRCSRRKHHPRPPQPRGDRPLLLFSLDPEIGAAYLVMEFVDGAVAGRPDRVIPARPQRSTPLFVASPSGLALAHALRRHPPRPLARQRHLARRRRRQPKIIDFGIARAANVGDRTLIGDNFAGKYNYVSPEQLGMMNGEVTDRSDIYSLGLVMAASLRGKALDMGGSQVEVIEKRRDVPDLSDIDEDLRPLVESMLQPNPADRPESIAHVAEWLRAMPDTSDPDAPEAPSSSGKLVFPSQYPKPGKGSRPPSPFPRGSVAPPASPVSAPTSSASTGSASTGSAPAAPPADEPTARPAPRNVEPEAPEPTEIEALAQELRELAAPGAEPTDVEPAAAEFDAAGRRRGAANISPHRDRAATVIAAGDNRGRSENVDLGSQRGRPAVRRRRG